MFTNASIALSEFASAGSMNVQRDREVSYVGKVPTQLPNRLVPCASTAQIEEAIAETGVSAIVTTSALAHLVPEEMGVAVADDPLAAAFAVHEALCDIEGFHWKSFETSVDSSSDIHPSAIIADNDVRIGKNCIIHPGAIILPRVIIDDDSAIGPGTVVGTDAFEVNTRSNPQRILRQAGGVWISKGVEVQAKCTIVRATFGGFTQLKEHCKLDCQIHIGHDSVVGARSRIAACAEISGRVHIAEDCFIGPNCSISNGIVIGKGAHVTLGAVVVRNVEVGARVTGNFAMPHRQFINNLRRTR